MDLKKAPKMEPKRGPGESKIVQDWSSGGLGPEREQRGNGERAEREQRGNREGTERGQRGNREGTGREQRRNR